MIELLEVLAIIVACLLIIWSTIEILCYVFPPKPKATVFPFAWKEAKTPEKQVAKEPEHTAKPSPIFAVLKNFGKPREKKQPINKEKTEKNKKKDVPKSGLESF